MNLNEQDKELIVGSLKNKLSFTKNMRDTFLDPSRTMWRTADQKIYDDAIVKNIDQEIAKIEALITKVSKTPDDETKVTNSDVEKATCEKVREALDLLKVYAFDDARVRRNMNWIDLDHRKELEDKIDNAVAVIKNALTDTTLEIVKRKLDETLAKIKLEKEAIGQTFGNGLIYGVLCDIINEAEKK